MEHSGWKWRSLALTTAWSYRLGARVQVWGPALLSVRLKGGAWSPACNQGVDAGAELRCLQCRAVAGSIQLAPGVQHP